MLIRRIHHRLRVDGFGGLFNAVADRLRRKRINGWGRLRHVFADRSGLEIGGPSRIFGSNGLLPIYPLASQIDNCTFDRQTLWEGKLQEGRTFRFDRRKPAGQQFILEASALHPIPDASYDFVASSHVLEHLANPFLALQEWKRVLRFDGILLMVLPHRDGTFDHRRPITSMAHLVQDFELGTDEGDLTHLDEVLRLHDLARDPEAGNIESFRQRSEQNLANRCLHHHVFDTSLAVEMIHHAGMKLLAVEPVRPCHIVILAQKVDQQRAMKNESFRGVGGAPCWSSPFLSDRRGRQPGSATAHPA